MSSTCPHNMVNFGLLTAEISPVVWGTPANFNGFRVFAALLHGSQVVGISAKLCSIEQRAPLMFSRATITLGIGPHSSFIYVATCKLEVFKWIITVEIIAHKGFAEHVSKSYWQEREGRGRGTQRTVCSTYCQTQHSAYAPEVLFWNKWRT